MRNETGFYPKVITTKSSMLKRMQTGSREQSQRVIQIRRKYPDMTLAVIGWHTGLTRQRVFQILTKAGLNTSSRL